jgi:hypothetical protein
LLSDLDETLARQLEERKESDDQFGHASYRVEQLGELEESSALKVPQDCAHAFTHGELFARNAMMP